MFRFFFEVPFGRKRREKKKKKPQKKKEEEEEEEEEEVSRRFEIFFVDNKSSSTKVHRALFAFCETLLEQRKKGFYYLV